MNDNTLQTMINNIKDPDIRKKLLNVAGGNIIKQVYCTNCKRVIADIYQDGQIIEISNSKKSGCRSSRQRLDGYMGFACRCGNWSIQSKQEQGILSRTGNMPTKKDLTKIAERINKNPSSYLEQDGAVEIDGFIIQDFRG